MTNSSAPGANASKAELVDYAVSNGVVADRGAAEQLSKDDLRQQIDSRQSAADQQGQQQPPQSGQSGPSV